MSRITIRVLASNLLQVAAWLIGVLSPLLFLLYAIEQYALLEQKVYVWSLWLVPICLLVAVWAVWVGRKYWWQFVVAGFPGWIIACFIAMELELLLVGTLLWWNGAMDASASILVDAKVQEHRLIPRDSGGDSSHRIFLVDERTGAPIELSFSKSRSTQLGMLSDAERMRVDDRIRLTVGRGKLRIPWIRRIERMDAPSP